MGSLLLKQESRKRGRTKSKVSMNENEIEVLHSDLIKIHRAMKDGLGCSFSELASVIDKLHKKREQLTDYKQVVID